MSRRLALPVAAYIEREDRDDVSLRRLLADEWSRAFAPSWSLLLSNEPTPPVAHPVLQEV